MGPSGPEQHSKKCHNPDHSALLGTPCFINQMMMLLLWMRHYLMAPIVVMMSAAAIN
jgi:hypothetical protein